MAVRQCVVPYCGRLTTTSRCQRHSRQRRGPGQIARLAVRGIATTSAERKRRREAVAEHRARFGDVCPGLPGRVGPHRVVSPNILTADHVRPQARGGTDGPIVVRCRSCNSARAAMETNARRRRVT